MSSTPEEKPNETVEVEIPPCPIPEPESKKAAVVVADAAIADAKEDESDEEEEEDQDSCNGGCGSMEIDVTRRRRHQENDESKLFRFSTKEGVCIKNLWERLRRYRDCTFRFVKTGVFMSAISESRTCMVQLSLNSLSDYVCNEEQVVGLDTINLFDVLRTANREDYVTLQMNKKQSTSPTVEVEIEDVERDTVTTYNMRTLDLEYAQHDIPPTKFDVVISMSSAQFQRVLRQCSAAGSRVHIHTARIDGRVALVFDASDASSRMGGTAADRVRVVVTLPGDNVVECRTGSYFNLNYLTEAARSGSMNPGGLVSISLCHVDESAGGQETDGRPIVIEHNVGTMGKLRHFIAPQLQEEDDIPLRDDAASAAADKDDNNGAGAARPSWTPAMKAGKKRRGKKGSVIVVSSGVDDEPEPQPEQDAEEEAADD